MKMKKEASTAILPHEMIMEILSWLPAKSLLKFKCVSKPWCASISNSNFIKLHFNRAIETDNTSLLLLNEPYYSNLDDPHIDMYSVEEGTSFDNPDKLEIPFDEFMVWGSCNGIVCFSTAFNLCLLNPATRCYKIVEFDNDIISGSSVTVKIAYGFFYDPFSEDLIAVVIVHPDTYGASDTDIDVEINVYPISDGSDSSLITVKTPYEIENEEQGGIYLSGALHWIGLQKHSRTRAIVSFHITEKVFQEVVSPNSLDKSASLSVGVSCGKLCMLSCAVNGMDMWMMNMYGVRESWCKLYSIPQSITRTVFGRGSLSFTINGEVLLQNHKNCISYDPKQKKAEHIEINVASVGTRPDMVVSYIASLVPLQSGIKLDT